MIDRRSFWLFMSTVILVCLVIAPPAQATHSLVYAPAQNLIDTTDFTGVPADGYWFANFANPNPVTGASMDSFEASNIPSWLQLITDPNDANFSFQNGPPISTSTGGQATYNSLTLPGGAPSGISGAAVDNANSSGGTDNFVEMIALAGAPSEALFWVVTDNCSGANCVPNKRLRFRQRHSDDLGDIQVEALPGAAQIGSANNGTADAYGFVASDIQVGDIFKIRITSTFPSVGSIAGIMVQVTPEPTSFVLFGLGAMGLACIRRR